MLQALHSVDPEPDFAVQTHLPALHLSLEPLPELLHHPALHPCFPSPWLHAAPYGRTYSRKTCPLLHYSVQQDALHWTYPPFLQSSALLRTPAKNSSPLSYPFFSPPFKKSAIHHPVRDWPAFVHSVHFVHSHHPVHSAHLHQLATASSSLFRHTSVL